MSQDDHYQSVLGDAVKAGVYHMPQVDPEPLIAAAETNGCAVFRVDLGGTRDKGGMLDAITRAIPPGRSLLTVVRRPLCAVIGWG